MMVVVLLLLMTVPLEKRQTLLGCFVRVVVVVVVVVVKQVVVVAAAAVGNEACESLLLWCACLRAYTILGGETATTAVMDENNISGGFRVRFLLKYGNS